MANEVVVIAVPSQTGNYAVVLGRPKDAQGGKVWNLSGSAWETLDTNPRSEYEVALTETPAASGIYVGDLPAGLSAVVNWRLLLYGSDDSFQGAATIDLDDDMTAVVIRGTVNDAGATTTDFDGDSSLEDTIDDFYNGSVLAFTSGSLKGIARKITGYTASSRNLAFTDAFPAAPGNGDAFEILGRID